MDRLCRRARPPRRPGPRAGGDAGRGGGPRPVHGRAAHAARRQWRVALDGVPGTGARRRRRRAGAHPRDGPRRHRGPSARPRRGWRPTTGRRRSPRWPPSSPTPHGWRTCPRSCSAGAQVLGAESSALAIFDSDGGPLRLHMTNRLTDEIQVHVEYQVAGVEIELDDTQPTQYAAMHGRRVLLADREEALARFPAVREGLDVLGIGAIAALPLRVEGRVLGAFVPLWSTAHTFAADDVEVLEALAAQIALSVSRLQADAERADGRHRDAGGEPAAAGAGRGGPDPVGFAGDRPAGRRAGRAGRPRARRLVLARRHRRAGPAARAWPSRTATPPAARRSRTTSARWSA